LAGSHHHDEKQIIARVAARDIGKAELVCCVRMPVPAGNKRRLQEVTTHSTMTKALTELANRLVELRVERLVMEATSSYRKPVFYLLEAHGLDPSLVNACDVKHLPGGPKPMYWTLFGCARWPSSLRNLRRVPGGRCWPRWRLANATRRCSPSWRGHGCGAGWVVEMLEERIVAL
jgi:hypothetical protein